MFTRNIDLVVGLTTFNNDMLHLSVPALSRLHGRFYLVVYNDNPTTTVSRRDIRRLGYRGRLRVINGTENIGVLRARMAIVNAVDKISINPQWILFVNDNDILVNVDIPSVGTDVFAVMQNAMSVRRRVGDLLTAINNPENCTADGENIVLIRPYTGICGVPVRMGVMRGLRDAIMPNVDKFQEIDDSLDFCPPFDAIMWSMVNTFARSQNASASPIYMDTVNYIMCNLDHATTKYGRTIIRGTARQSAYSDAIARYDAVLAAALRGDTDTE